MAYPPVRSKAATDEPERPVNSASGQHGRPLPGVDIDRLFEPWRTSEGRLVDVLALVVAVSVAMIVEFDTPSPIRPAVALCFFTAIPGWMLVRLAGAKPSSLSAFGAIGLSVALTQLGGELLVTQLNWAWRPTTTAVAIACAVGLGLVIVRDMAAPP